MQDVEDVNRVHHRDHCIQSRVVGQSIEFIFVGLDHIVGIHGELGIVVGLGPGFINAGIVLIVVVAFQFLLAHCESLRYGQRFGDAGGLDDGVVVRILLRELFNVLEQIAA